MIQRFWSFVFYPDTDTQEKRFFGHWRWEWRDRKHLLSWVLGTASFLHNPLTALAPPHHQRRHEKGDQDGHNNKWTQDAVGRVHGKPSGQRAVVKVVPVDPDEELIHQPVGPEAVHLQRYQVRAVCQLLVEPAGQNKKEKAVK